VVRSDGEPTEHGEHVRHVELDGDRTSHDFGPHPDYMDEKQRGAGYQQCELPDSMTPLNWRSTAVSKVAWIEDAWVVSNAVT